MIGGRYRKRPVVVEAVRVDEVLDADYGTVLPEWLLAALAGEVVLLVDAVIIGTREGSMRGDRGDWIIRGVQGELYPCKPDIFEATYKKADDG